ncbi:hypothetical protein D3C81_1000600 [compost metagenome]
MVVQLLDGRFLQEQVHHVRRQLGTLGFPVQAAQEVFRGGGVFGFADQLELVSAIADLDGQALFDQAQMLVELPAQIGEAASFKRLEDETMWFYGCVQGRI